MPTSVGAPMLVPGDIVVMPAPRMGDRPIAGPLLQLVSYPVAVVALFVVFAITEYELHLLRRTAKARHGRR